MADNQELFQALNMFKQGVQDFGMQRAISQANDQVQQIRDSSLAEDEKQQQFRNLSQDMTLKFMAAGAPESQIQTFQNAFKPPEVKAQTFEQAALSNEPQLRARGEAGIKQKQQFTKEENRAKIDATLEGYGIKATEKEKVSIGATVKDFQKVGKAELDGLDTLAAVPEDVTNNLEYTSALKALIKRTDPRISDADYKLATPNVDLQSRAKRAYDALIQNKPLPEDAEAVQTMIGMIRSKTESRLIDKIKGYSVAQTGAKSFRTMDAAKLENVLTSQYLPRSVTGQSNLPASAAPQQQAPAGMGSTANPAQAPSTQVGPSKYFR